MFPCLMLRRNVLYDRGNDIFGRGLTEKGLLLIYSQNYINDNQETM